MTSRLRRVGAITGMAAAPAASYLYTHPEARAPVATAFRGAINTAAPIVRDITYRPPPTPVDKDSEIDYRNKFVEDLTAAKATGYTDETPIAASSEDLRLRRIFDRATYFAKKRGLPATPTTIGGAEKVYQESIQGWGDWAMSFIKKSEPKPLTGGKRKARRSKRSGSKRSKRSSKHSRRNRSRRN